MQKISAKTSKILRSRKITHPMFNNESPIPSYHNHQAPTFALIQPGCYGDNINSTLMLKPIKEKHPDSIIDVWTSTTYGSAFYNNPYIDHLYELPSNSKDTALHQLITIPDLIKNCGYTKIFNPHPMVNPDKWTSIKAGYLGTNIICAWVRALEEADIPYTMPLETLLYLTDQEKENVNKYCSQVNMSGQIYIMEVSGESGQTFWNGDWTTKVCQHLLGHNSGLSIIISKRETDNVIDALKHLFPNRIFFAGNLTLRECAELYNRCDGFFSVSSGLSNICNTNYCKKDKLWIETVNGPSVTSAPIRAAGKRFWHENNLHNFLDMLQANNL